MTPIEVREEKELLSYENHTGDVFFTHANGLKFFQSVLSTRKLGPFAAFSAVLGLVQK